MSVTFLIGKRVSGYVLDSMTSTGPGDEFTAASISRIEHGVLGWSSSERQFSTARTAIHGSRKKWSMCR